MAVDSRHRDYAKAALLWDRARDAFAGSDAIKAKGFAYLPLLEGHEGLPNTRNLYAAYVLRAMFYPALARTVSGLTGIVFAKEPTVDGLPTSEESDLEDLTLTGVSFAGYALQLCTEVLTVGRAGTLIDLPMGPESGKRPYSSMYSAENIINWRIERINGVQVLKLLVLREEHEDYSEDEFQAKVVEKYRVFRLVDGRCQVSLYTADPENKGKYILENEMTPLRRGAPIPYIPFIFLGPTGIGPDIEHAPLQDLVDVNISHYRTSADQEHGAHFIALPTVWLRGYRTQNPNDPIPLGPGSVLLLDENGQAGMLEFSGAGMQTLADLKEEKRQLMATLGARMLETQKNAQESADAIKLRHQGERSALSVLASALGQHMTLVLRWHLFWKGFNDNVLQKIRVTINIDEMDSLSAEDIKTLVLAWQSGAISKKTLYSNLEWGEWTRPGITFEEEEKDIKEEDPGDTLDLQRIPPGQLPPRPTVVDPLNPEGDANAA